MKFLGTLRYLFLKKCYQHVVGNAVLDVCTRPGPVLRKKEKREGYNGEKYYLGMSFENHAFEILP